MVTREMDELGEWKIIAGQGTVKRGAGGGGAGTLSGPGTVRRLRPAWREDRGLEEGPFPLSQSGR